MNNKFLGNTLSLALDEVEISQYPLKNDSGSYQWYLYITYIHSMYYGYL